ncbi:hypothetical protein, partial [Loktanella fryxellensis]|uniref:hypothetical protein n=1 Tax=Loktanella fryxellensis TaxID=245187 RepID=UPI001C4352B4
HESLSDLCNRAIRHTSVPGCTHLPGVSTIFNCEKYISLLDKGSEFDRILFNIKSGKSRGVVFNLYDSGFELADAVITISNSEIDLAMEGEFIRQQLSDLNSSRSKVISRNIALLVIAFILPFRILKSILDVWPGVIKFFERKRIRKVSATRPR